MTDQEQEKPQQSPTEQEESEFYPGFLETLEELTGLDDKKNYGPV